MTVLTNPCNLSFIFFLITLSFVSLIHARNSKFLNKKQEPNLIPENANSYVDNNKDQYYIRNSINKDHYSGRMTSKVTNFVEPSDNNDYYYYNNNNQLQDLSKPTLMDKGYTTTSTSTTNPTNTKDYPYKNGDKSDNNSNRYMLSEEHVNFRGYHGNEDDYNDETEPHMP